MSRDEPRPTHADPTETPLDVLLRDESYRFQFFQAVRLLQQLAPEREAVGMDALPGDEAVRFTTRATLVFPASEIHELTFSPDKRQPPRLMSSFMGLTGPSGALPRHYTEWLLERIKQKDHTLREFLDLFNHRLISLFYRAWEKYRGIIGFERAEVAGRRRRHESAEAWRSFVFYERPKIDRVSQVLLELDGLGEPSLRFRATVRDELMPRRQTADETLRYYAGLLAQRHRSAVGLEQLLEDYFGVTVEVQQFCGQWLLLSEENQSRFVAYNRNAPFAGNMRLGVDVVVGERVWDVQSKFRVRIGPLKYDEFRRFLPDGDAYEPLTHLVRLYAGAEFDFDVQLVLLRTEVPPLQLGGGGNAEPRLGWNSWSWTQEFEHDVADAMLVVHDS
jgi:type VI secretion system protein ImpH